MGEQLKLAITKALVLVILDFVDCLRVNASSTMGCGAILSQLKRKTRLASRAQFGQMPITIANDKRLTHCFAME